MNERRWPHLVDEILVLRARSGDLTAFDELARRFRGAATMVAAQALGTREGADDVAQEALLLAFRALPQLEEPEKFAGWLCAITRRRALRVAGRDARCRPVETSRLDRIVLAHSPALRADPVAEWARGVARDEVREALDTLPDELRAVLYLRYWEQWPVARIAAFLSLPLTTVKWRLHDARRRLGRLLAEQPEETIDERRA